MVLMAVVIALGATSMSDIGLLARRHTGHALPTASSSFAWRYSASKILADKPLRQLLQDGGKSLFTMTAALAGSSRPSATSTPRPGGGVPELDVKGRYRRSSD